MPLVVDSSTSLYFSLNLLLLTIVFKKNKSMKRRETVSKREAGRLWMSTIEGLLFFLRSDKMS